MKYYSTGDGLINDAINKLPFELHVPTYNFLGPGTRLDKRLARKDKPKNKLDEAAMEHDIFYRDHKRTKERHQADKILAKKAMERFHSKDASIGEKLTALATAGVMKTKVKLGMGLSKPNYKQMIRHCIKMLVKTKTTLELSLKNIQDCLLLLNSNELPKKKQTSKRVVKKKTKQKQDMEVINNMDVDIVDDYPMGKIERKRKNSTDELNMVSSKKIKLSDHLPKIIAKRKLKNESELNNLQLDEPVKIAKKRKLENDDVAAVAENDLIPHKVQVINPSDI